MASYVGLKLANGLFYTILTEKAPQKKRLVLTTVTDNQASVQIDLYRTPDKSMTAARYVGTLVVEHIQPKKKGEPSIELIIEYAGSGEIKAQAVDMEQNAGERQYLSVSLKALSGQDSAQPARTDERRFAAPRGGGVSAGLIALIALAVLGAGFAFWFFLLGGKALLKVGAKPPPPVETAAPKEPAPVVIQAPPVPPPPPAPAETAAPPPPAPEDNPAAAAPVEAPPPSPPPQSAPSRARLAAPVMSYNVPVPIPAQGVWYTVRWGDTLWAISEAFYRDPWRYRFLARYNNIPNPSLIISGERIKIPQRP